MAGSQRIVPPLESPFCFACAHSSLTASPMVHFIVGRPLRSMASPVLQMRSACTRGARRFFVFRRFTMCGGRCATALEWVQGGWLSGSK